MEAAAPASDAVAEPVASRHHPIKSLLELRFNLNMATDPPIHYLPPLPCLLGDLPSEVMTHPAVNVPAPRIFKFAARAALIGASSLDFFITQILYHYQPPIDAEQIQVCNNITHLR
jgi:hypothetical protein